MTELLGIGIRLPGFRPQPRRCLPLLLLTLYGAPSAVLAQRTIYDPEYVITNWQTEDGLPENSATSIVQTADGYLWFGTFDGLVRFDGAKFTVFDQSNTPELASAGIVNLHLDQAGRLWVSTVRGTAYRSGDIRTKAVLDSKESVS